MTKAEEAVEHIIGRLTKDPRLAYMIGPLTEAYLLLIEAYAEIKGLELDAFQEQFEKSLKFERWPSEAECPECHEQFSLMS